MLFIFLAIVLLFSFVLLFGPPFLPTLRGQTKNAIEMLNLKSGQTLIELGSGDGRVLKEAAAKGVRAIGYEINPALVIYSKIATYKKRQLIQIHWGNFWKAPLEKADGIYIFGLGRYMEKLNNKIVQECKQPVRVVSFAFRFPKIEPEAEKGGLYLYKFTGSPDR